MIAEKTKSELVLEEFKALKNAVREYLQYSSADGKLERRELRERLKNLINENPI